MDAQHTPGPWKVGRDNYGHPIVGTSGASADVLGYLIAGDIYAGQDNPHTPKAKAEAHANARLIAAVPDLLTALRDLYAVCRELPVPRLGSPMHAAMLSADAAIRKAEQG